MLGKNANVHSLIMNQIQDVKATLISFESFMRAALTPNSALDTLEALDAGVSKAEAAADVSLRKMIDSLVDANYLPSTKSELIDIAAACDRIANKCESVSNTMVLQNFRLPEVYSEDVMAVISHTHEQFALLEEAISLMFSNFKALVKDHAILDSIRRKESTVDRLEKNMHRSIFNSSEELAKKMQLVNTIELICDISDVIENIADKLQIMLITRKA